jgi:hypothetical protein
MRTPQQIPVSRRYANLCKKNRRLRSAQKASEWLQQRMRVCPITQPVKLQGNWERWLERALAYLGSQ